MVKGLEEIVADLEAFQEDLAPVVFSYLTQTLANVLKDEADPADWQATLAPILASCGWQDDRLDRLFATVKERVLAGYSYEERNEEVVPFETPVQISSNIVSENAAQGRVRLDWLSTRKVLVSRVDRARLGRLEARHRQRREKRGLTASPYGQEQLPSAELSGANEQPQTSVDQASLDKAMLEDLLEHGVTGSGHHVHDQGAGRSRDIKIDDFDIAIHGKRILTNASLTVASGRRYGLVGRNGIGKSTLLRHLSARALPVPLHLSVLHVEQEIVGDDTPAITSVLQADRRRVLLLREEERLQRHFEPTPDSPHETEAGRDASERLLLVHKRLQECGADDAEARAAIILSGLGFAPAAQLLPTRTFSGGWRMRIALARALFCQPDLLLLDEPTNMLDIPAVAWLEDYLQGWPSTLIVVSHDRFFLDAVATDILHLHSERLDAYRGNYTQFTVTREEHLKQAQREYETQLAYRQHLQAFVDRWRYSAARASQAQSRLKILEKLPDLEPVVMDPPVVFRFPPIDSLPPPLVTLSGVSFAYGPASTAAGPTASSSSLERAPLLSGVDLHVDGRSRLAIVGPNGAGKTTLLKLLTGQLEPIRGMVSRNSRMRCAVFSQHQVDQLDMSVNAVELFSTRLPGKIEEEYRRLLGAFGISGPLALQQIGTLSGGQKSRVSFALLAAQQPHLLVLDEPTNHLDMDSIDGLIAALADYQGAVVCVSHDKRFVNAVCNEIWVCAHGSVVRFVGTIMEYCRSLLS